MRRFPWDILFALLLGVGAGIMYAWIIAPQGLANSNPALLRADFKDQFRLSIAASYTATGNLPRAQARLALLGDNNPIETLNAQAQREIASGNFTQADQLAVLASALENGTAVLIQITPTPETFEPIDASEPTITAFPSPEDIPFVLTETLESPDIPETQSIATQLVISTPTPRPTRTPLPTQGAPFRLISADTVCDPNLPDGLLQVVVYNSNRRQLAGIKVIITWDTGGEEFFTGLKPELGNGYADFLMFSNTSHAVQLAIGSEIATDLVPLTCETSSGETYLGGYKLTFQQP